MRFERTTVRHFGHFYYCFRERKYEQINDDSNCRFGLDIAFDFCAEESRTVRRDQDVGEETVVWETRNGDGSDEFGETRGTVRHRIRWTLRIRKNDVL